MIRTIKYLVLCLLLVPSAVHAAVGDTLELRFRLNETDIDLGYADNSLRLDNFMARLQQLSYSQRCALCIKVFAGASPDGPAELNRRLGEYRGLSLRRLLSERMEQEGLDPMCSRIMVINEGARWGRLYQEIQQSDEPWRDSVLDVLRQQPPKGNEWQIDPREEQLRQLGGGVWQQLRDGYLPRLRSVGTAVLAPIAEAGRRDTLVIRDTIYYMPYPVGEVHEVHPATAGVYYGHGQGAVATAAYRKPEKTYVHDRPWAVKGNLLLLAITTPAIHVEKAIGNRGRWSVELEILCAWWTLSHNAYANQLQYGSLELRHWLGNRQKHHTLSGWHLGLAVGAGRYDLEWRSRGYQGEALNCYLNIGFQHRFGQKRQWCFDVGAGLGMLVTDYKEYKGSTLYPGGHEEPYDDHLMWQRNGRLDWPGLCHLNISVGKVF